MPNGIRKLYVNNDKDALLNLESTASLLGISSATVKNWVKSGYLKTSSDNTKNLFHLSEIENIKSNIANGYLAKLNKRANKSNADRTFIPEEYLQGKSGYEDLNKVVNFIQQKDIDVSLALLLITLNLLEQEKLLISISIENIQQNKDLSISREQIKKELESWLLSTEKITIEKEYAYLLNCPLPKHRDVLGFIYQSLLLEGKKSQSGSYYTPSKIVDEIVYEYVKKDSKVLDPCCGTGQFLLAFASIIEDPNNIYGVDTDEIAVRIARINLLIWYKDKDFAPNIVCKNTLFDIGIYDLFSLNDENIKDFDVIATNPPWGIHFTKQDSDRLKSLYPQITSFESFSYFLKKGHELLRSGGVLSFILPESLLNVKTHKDIREYILNSSQIKKIVYLDRVFKNVFTPVIRLDFEKNIKDDAEVVIQKENQNYTVNQKRWRNNQDYVFDIHVNGFDSAIIDKIYNTPHTILENQADWALGIVTGSNSRYVSASPKTGYEEVYKGKDIEKFILKTPSSYIQFAPDKFQQVAPIEKYRANEKLIYRFISKNLVFAYDNKQKLTLNSANIVIPKIPDYPKKVIAAFFNSSLCQFVFQKKFASIKVLRSHIGHLPLPLWGEKVFNEIVEMVDKVIQGQLSSDIIDNYIMDKYSLSMEERNYIKEFNK